VKSEVRCSTAPLGAMTALTPTVEICTVARPCSTARSRLIASCCVDSAVWPKLALFVWTTSTSPPVVTAVRTMSSYATSKQMTSPMPTVRCRRGEESGT
jgi:hypothetical protein